MGRLWRLISSTYLVSFYKTTFQSGTKTLYKIIPIAFLKSWNKHFPNYEEQQKSPYVVEEPQQQVGEWVEVYYERLLKLANYLQVKDTIVFFIIIFRARLQPYRKLAITSMAIDIIIKHKEVAVIYEDNGPIISNYNTLIT
jgi:hypothetical protein